MRHLTITDYGHYIGVTGNRLIVKDEGAIITELPLSRLRSISIAKDGVSLSSNLITACAGRGIRIYVLDWRGISVAALTGQHQHAIAALRQAQFEFLETNQRKTTAAGMIYGKLRNQRAVLLYFNKYLSHKHTSAGVTLTTAAESINNQCVTLRETQWDLHETWREEIMGLEGVSAHFYWQALVSTDLLPKSFVKRQGRGATEITNQLLNYGYTLLTSYIWSALANAGFELYAGILHSKRSGKPSLVLDMMEEYRSWVVDRNVIKMRAVIEKANKLTPKLKKRLATAIQETISKKHPYRGKKARLETIMQRQAYRLSATIVDGRRYQPYRFRW